MDMKNRGYIKIFMAFLLAPYLAAISYILFGFGLVFSEVENLFALTHLVASYTYPAAIIFGLPGYFILKKLDRLTLYSFALTIGVSGFFLSHFVTLGGYREGSDLGANIRAFIAGVLGATLFWVIITGTKYKRKA